LALRRIRLRMDICFSVMVQPFPAKSK
jgi:hypothetical protein